MIANHYSARLSELDVEMVRAVGPGGNWKDIPDSIPSKRLAQIRTSYAAGEGSRSTYYGRLKAADPAYTISTYFNRPGNGCFIHYDVERRQHRLISQREGARLQSFPDSFVFLGNKSQIYKQIGNAVPPLLAFQIARSLGRPGEFVDLFSGAGGLSLGFHWAGWRGLVANDLEASFLATHRENLRTPAVTGDIENEAVRDEIVARALASRRDKGAPFYVLGGPPCQGFSTAGNARSMSDERNHLFKRYTEILQSLNPHGFIFENVPGLLNMQGGRVFDLINRSLAAAGYELRVWKLNAEEYGVPQRRTRVFIVGTQPGKPIVSPPAALTYFSREKQTLFESTLSRVCGVRDALGDLPLIAAGEDGSDQPYASKAQTTYQQFMRGELSPNDYIARLVREPRT